MRTKTIITKRHLGVFFILVTFPLARITQAQYGGGTGEPNNPYQISTIEHLITIGSDPNLYDKHFVLTANINLEGYTFNKAIIAPGQWGGRGQGVQGIPFSGSFDGQGFTIQNLSMQEGEFMGLFGLLGPGAHIINLGLLDVNINAKHGPAGGLVALNNSGTIENIYCIGTVVGDHHVGGLVGRNESGIIINSYSEGTVNGTDNAGGLVGLNESGDISISYSKSTVSGSYYVGGLVGRDEGSITSCYSTGMVDGYRALGGLVGYNMGFIICSYSTGTVSGDYEIGGLVGSNSGSITSSYCFGIVIGKSNTGGLAGRGNEVSVINSFWDTQSSGWNISAGGIGKTTVEMQDPNTFIDAGWDFVDEIANGTSDFWQMPEQEGPPVLSRFNNAEQQQPEGSGTIEDPYLITEVSDLGSIWYRPFAHYILTNNIDLSDILWSTAPIPWFDGTFDGNGFHIENLHIQGAGLLGLFGKLRSNANVQYLRLLDFNISGTSNDIGGLAGSNYGIIINSGCTGTIDNGYQNIGGLVGQNLGSISNSYSTVNVNGEGFAVGMAGTNNGSIINSYSCSTVSGDYILGGLAGTNSAGSIVNSYSTGIVTGLVRIGGLVGYYYGNIVSSFWDIQSSGIDTIAGGIGKTTSEMQTVDTFLDAGWDFVDETINGTKDIWWILDGRDYPRLWWEPTENE
jgi:hypothetical protein